MSLNVFSKGQTEGDIIVHWKKLNGKQANCLALASKIEPASFAILQQIRNSTGWSATLTWQLVFRASIQLFVVPDAAVQMQHITNHLVKVPFILNLQSTLLLWGYFHLFRQIGSQHLWKCLLKGMKEPSVSPWTTACWQRRVLDKSSWAAQISCTKFWLQFISSVLHFRCDRNNCIHQSAIKVCIARICENRIC